LKIILATTLIGAFVVFVISIFGCWKGKTKLDRCGSQSTEISVIYDNIAMSSISELRDAHIVNIPDGSDDNEWRETPNNTSKNNDNPETIPNDNTETIPNDNHEAIPNDNHEAIPNDNPKTIPNDNHEAIPNDNPETEQNDNCKTKLKEPFLSVSALRRENSYELRPTFDDDPSDSLYNISLHSDPYHTDVSRCRTTTDGQSVSLDLNGMCFGHLES